MVDTDCVFLNGQYLPLSEAKISPMDRGFLFGDGVYEVIPSYDGRCVGLSRHIQRLNNNLAEIGITLSWTENTWAKLTQRLLTKNGAGNLSVYIQVSRGTDSVREHAFPNSVTPTVFACCMTIPPAPIANRDTVSGLKVICQADTRWKNCHIKSTSLLGNVLHFQRAQEHRVDEVLLFNSQGMLTEASKCNVFVVIEQQILTPVLSNQLLAGITRGLLIDILHQHTGLHVKQVDISVDSLVHAQEVWLTSSTKEVAPVVEVDGRRVGDGQAGSLWQQAQSAFSKYKFDY